MLRFFTMLGVALGILIPEPRSKVVTPPADDDEDDDLYGVGADKVGQMMRKHDRDNHTW